jgi:hypothetical protein
MQKGCSNSARNARSRGLLVPCSFNEGTADTRLAIMMRVIAEGGITVCMRGSAMPLVLRRQGGGAYRSLLPWTVPHIRSATNVAKFYNGMNCYVTTCEAGDGYGRSVASVCEWVCRVKRRAEEVCKHCHSLKHADAIT